MSINKRILTILSTDIFKKLINSDTVQIAQLNAAITLLIESRIPFDLQFSPGTRRDATAADLLIYINPTTTVSFTISFDPGGSIFSN
ncbi:MAG: hypothetical protein FH753_16415 [Firmicutes bacterium]|nr:hypothetical protein [Bacillota bacterium]